MNRWRGLVRAVGAVALAGAGFVGGCLAPTLPLPPPDAPTFVQPSAAEPSEWTVLGACAPGAIVFLLNEVTHEGVLLEDVDADGSYSVIIEGTQCDAVSVWQQLGGETSSTTSFLLEPTDPANPGAPTVCQ